MLTIPTAFDGTRDQKGFRFTLIDRIKDVCLFSKTKQGHSQTYYEVVRLKKVPQRTFPNGVTTPEHEALPSPEEWGTHGYSPATLADARTRFNQLTEA